MESIKNIKKRLLFAKVLLLAFVALFLISACQNNELNNPIGGQKDEYGCLTPAGFSWNETIGACVKQFELDESQAKAAQIAVAPLSYRPITVVKVETLRCLGCFIVTLQSYDNKPIEIKLINWKFSNDTDETINSFEDCVNAGFPIMESHPRQCAANGKTFTENLENNEKEDKEKHYCTEQEKKAEICTLEYMPVCGNNGKTYGNKCAACASKEIEYYVTGECYSNKECGSCPFLSKPSPDWCKEGKILQGKIDECGCQGPPICEPVACTMDAKQCPDGSYVGRIAPDCDFAPCPK